MNARWRERADSRCGLARTSPLRFDHPGLGTTATRSGDRLVLQNDIGTTDAHVPVIHVEGRETSFTYTDVHLQRLLFLQAMFDGRGVRWDDARLVQDRAMEDGRYHLVIGRHVAPDDAGVESFLEYLGSRLVFLIDWNRVRKQLRRLVGKKPARRVLEWAAAEDVGHMAFLRVGGADAVLTALGQVVGARGHFGQTLEDVLGAERAEPFLRFALRMATEALLTGRAEALVVDEYRAEIARQARSAADEALDLAADHVGLVAEIAAAVREAATCVSLGDATARLAARCKQWESDADRVLVQVREIAHRAPETAHLRALVERSDDVADDFEECAFLLTLLDGHELDAAVRRGIAELAGQLLAGTREVVRITELLRTLAAAGAGDDVREFLDAIHRIGRIEHDTDTARRQVLVRLVSGDVVPRAEEVGGKALGLFRLSRLGVPVPPAVVLGTGWCREFHARGGSLPEDLMPRLEAALRYVEDVSDLRFGSPRHPLLVSVRSGAPVSMPGMMETVLNVGLSDATLSGFLRVTGNPRLVWDSYRRLVEGFAEVVAACRARRSPRCRRGTWRAPASRAPPISTFVHSASWCARSWCSTGSWRARSSRRRRPSSWSGRWARCFGRGNRTRRAGSATHTASRTRPAPR